ncbi:MAG: hypothetical protein ACRC5T_10660 [Cetobacterium sp.]
MKKKITILFTEEMIDTIKVLAKKEDRSFTNMVLVIIKKGLETK